VTDINPFTMDIDDPAAPWNRDPVEFLPKFITPGRIAIRFWEIGEGDDPTALDFSFTWSGGREADWLYDISDKNPGLSVGSSSPFGGEASWGNGDDVEITYRGFDAGVEGQETLCGSAPTDEMLTKPPTWVALAKEIAGICDRAR
jgi:hypothetical protein